MADEVEILLEVYRPFRGARVWRGKERVPVGMTVGHLLTHLKIWDPEMAVLVGGRSVAPETRLQSGDEVAILRQAEGG